MVSVNVAQLLLSPLGTTRDFDFREGLPDPDGDLHLRGPVSGHAHLIRTSDGILVHTDHRAPVTLECSRCLDEVKGIVEGTLDEEFLPTTDVHTGVPVAFEGEDDQPRINEHHEIDLDEVLRQDILTNLPLHPLCDTACPGLCETCGQRLDQAHTPHETEPPVDESSPFARLAVLLSNSDTEER
ncbi:MAG: DUF177 domain-containing protein [Chloroflexi bacterium]|nr:DUF177 domain-containing protein [Chloroflexota bacterium]MBV9545971.1 DUF177 domain-containing protein [Chloroflexota bacterium]